MFKRILVTVDGSPPSKEAVRVAAGLARDAGSSVRLLHVLDATAYLAGHDPMSMASGQLFTALRDSARQVLAQAEGEVRAAGVAVESALLDEATGRLGDIVAQEAERWQADLVVVGTHGRRGPSRLLLGSGAEEILRLAPVPVLVTRVAG